MFEILSEKFIRFGNGLSEVRAEIVCDTAEDLPEKGEISGRILAMGSLAWDVSTGDFYALNSAGEWKNQNVSAETEKVQNLQFSDNIAHEISESGAGNAEFVQGFENE